jgi:hypothetical protein
VLWEFLLE